MFQKYIGIGFISAPEARKNSNNRLFIRFGMAIQERQNDPTTWMNCIIGGPFAEVMADKLKKGQLVFVEGKLSVREQDGEKYTNVLVDTCRILRDPSFENGGQRKQASEHTSDDDFEDDIPF